MKIKIISLNLWRGGVLMDNVISFIKKENPDILLLQEVQNGLKDNLPDNFKTVDMFKKNLSYPYCYYSPMFLEETEYGNIDNGNAIYSKFPFLSTKTVFLDFYYRKRISGTNSDQYTKTQTEEFLNTPRNMQITESKIGETVLSLVNVHGIWGPDGNDNSRRLKMGEKIIQEIKNKQNIIMAGDFNMRPTSQTIEKIENYVKNIFKGELKSTFNMRRKTNRELASVVVDMMFASQNLKIVNHYCPKVDVSDHLPLVCVFDVK